MSEIGHRTVRTNGIETHIAEAGEGPLVLLLHGFPESWYSWRHQLRALAEAGYHAVAPDVRGYGRTEAPQAIEAYSMKELTADAVGVLDALGEKNAAVVGHDWGASVAWNSAALYPDRFRAVVGMSVPYLPRSPMPPTQLFKKAFGERWFYILYFQEPGKAEAELEADVPRSMRLFLAWDGTFDARGQQPRSKSSTFFEGMTVPASLPAWLTEADLAFYVAEFQRTGFRGGLNRYRNMDRDWHELPELADLRPRQPALFITGERDPVKTFAPDGPMKALLPDLRGALEIPGAGHWVQQERPAEVNAALLGFLAKL